MPAKCSLLIAAAFIVAALDGAAATNPSKVAATVGQANDRPAAPPRDGVSAEKPQFVAAQKSKSADEKSDRKKARKFRGRLPQYYGQIGLSDKQRKKIYSIQISYREQLQKLEQQLRDLRAKQGSEIDAVLTSEQKKKLSDLLEAARKKRDARKNRKEKKPRSKTTDKKAAS